MLILRNVSVYGFTAACLLTCSFVFAQTTQKVTAASPTKTNAWIEAAAKAGNIPPLLVKAIAWQESKWTHLTNGTVKRSSDGGVGIMQIQNGSANSEEQNILEGVARLNGKWALNVNAGAREAMSKIGGIPEDFQPDILENWFVPLAAYNGYIAGTGPSGSGGGKGYARTLYGMLANPNSYQNLRTDGRTESVSPAVLPYFNQRVKITDPKIIPGFDGGSSNQIQAYGLCQMIKNGGVIHRYDFSSKAIRDITAEIKSKCGGTVGNGSKVVNQPNISVQIQKDQRLAFSVQTDKPAEQVKITFQNPFGEVALTGSGTQWNFDRQITAVGSRPWVISVWSGGKVSDDHLRGTLVVKETLDDFMLQGKIVGPIEAPAHLNVNDEMKVRVKTTASTQKVSIDFGNNTSFDFSPDEAKTTWTWSKPISQPGRRDFTVRVFVQGRPQPSDQRAGSVQVDGTGNSAIVHPLPGHSLARTFADPDYPKVFGVEHTGVDWMAPVGTPVKAICGGSVTGNRTNRPDVVNAVLSIQHNCGGNQVYAYYGHIASSLNVGATVKSGDTIGSIRQYGSNNHHLHFGVKKDLVAVGWGRAPRGTSRQAMLNSGWLDPEEFLRSTSGFTQTRVNPFEIAPQDRVTREQFGTSLLDAVPSVGQSYTGTPEQRIRAAGLIQNDFRGGEPVIRADAIRMTYRLLSKHTNLAQLIGVKPLERFNLDADLDDDPELRQQANTLAALGVATGIQNGTIFELEPGRQMSRNEQAGVIDRVRALLGAIGSGIGPKIVNSPSIPTAIDQNGRLTFTVNTDKPAEKVVMLFQNPDGEAPLTGSGTSFTFDRPISATGMRPWKLRVYANNNQVTDEHLTGTLSVRPSATPSMIAVQAQGALMINTPGTLVFTGSNLTANVRVTLADCENGQTQLVSPTQIVHKCVPRRAGQVLAGWKADAAVLNPINVGTVTVQDPAAKVGLNGPLAAKVDAFVSTWTGNPVDVDKSYGYQCVDLMHQYAKDVLGRDGEFSKGNAYSIFVNTNSPNLRKVTNTPSAVPTKGDVIFWKPAPSNGNAGHVAIFVNGDAKNFNSFDQNFCVNSGAGTGQCAPRLVSHNYDGVAGWISTSTPTIPAPLPVASASLTSVQPQGNVVVNAIATFIFQGQNLTTDVRVTVGSCDQPQTQLLSPTQIRHQCIPRHAGQQPLGWKANSAEPNIRPLGDVNIGDSAQAQ
jgi:murein DD-endopeptidase MepM/ murein hydrolase activator NlpD